MLKQPGSMSMLTKLLFKVLVISVLPATNYGEVIGSRYDGLQGTDYHFPTDTMHMTPTDGSDRFRRAPDGGFHENVDRMTMLARVLTGISLQNGLIDESIPGDEAIAEMLNIGSVKLADLETFDKTNVDTFVTNLKKASENIADSTKELETEVAEAIAMKEKWENITGLDKLPKSVAFDKINILGTFDFSALSNKTIVDAAVANLRSFMQLPLNVSGDANNVAVTVMKNLEKSLATVDKAITKIKTVNSTLKPKEIQEVVRKMKPFEKLASLMIIFNQASTSRVLRNPTATTTVLKSNLQLIKDITLDETSLATAHSLLSSLSKHDPSSIKHTAGFVDGFHDLVQLPAASKNSWVLLALNTSMPIEEGLKPLEQFKSPMNALGGTLSTLKDWNLRQSVEKAIDIQQQIREAENSAERVDPLINGFHGCNKPSSSTTAETTMKSISDAVTGLEKKLMALEAIIGMVTEGEVEQFNTFKNKIDLSNDARQHGYDVERIVPKLKTLNTAEKIVNFLLGLEPHLEVIQDAPSFKNLVDDLTPKKTVVIGLDKDMDTMDYTNYFKCLAGVQGSTKELSLATKVFKEVRALKGTTDLFDNINKVTGAMANSTNDIKTVRAIPGKIKTSNSSEVKELTKFKNLATDAKKVGEAAAGVIAIQKAAAEKKSIEELISKGADVDAAIQAMADGQKKEEIRKGWGDFNEFKKKLEYLLEGLKNRVPVKGSTLRRRLRRRPTEFDSLVQFCAGQAGLIDVVLNVDEKITALDSLIVLIKPPSVNVNRFRSLLPAVGQLDLRFARHNGPLTGLNGVLNSIQNLFTTVQPTRINPGGGSNPGSPNGGGGSGGGGSGGGSRGGATGGAASATEATGGVPTWVYPTVACIVISIVAVVVGIWYKWKRDKKAKELEEELEKEKEETLAYVEKLLAGLALENEKKVKNFQKREADSAAAMEEAQKKAKQLEEDVAREEKLKEDARMLYEKAVKEAKNKDEKAKNQDEEAKKKDEETKKKDENAMKKLLKDYQEKQKQVEFKTKMLKEARMKAKYQEKEAKRWKLWCKGAEATSNWKGNQLREQKATLEMVLAEGNERVKPLPLEDFKRRIQIDGDFRSTFFIGVLTYLTHRVAYRVPSIELFELNDEEEEGSTRRVTELFYMEKLEDAMKKVSENKKACIWPSKEMRNPDIGKFQNRSEPPSTILPSNWYHFRITSDCIVSQLPLPGPQQEEFYRLLEQEKIKYAVYFGTPGDEKNFPTAQNEQKDFGRYRYETKSVEVVVEGELVKRELHSVNATTNHNFTHYEFLNWQDEEIPKTKAFRDAFEKAHRATRRNGANHKGYTMVYDRDGSFKAGVFVAVEAFIQEIIDTGLRMMELEDFLKNVNETRFNMLTKGEQVFFVQLMALQISFHDLDGEIPQQLETQWAIFEAFNDEKYDKQCREMAGKGGKLGEKPKEAPMPKQSKKPIKEEKSKMEAPKQQEKKEKKEKKEKMEEQVSMVGTVAATQCDEVSAKGQI